LGDCWLHFWPYFTAHGQKLLFSKNTDKDDDDDLQHASDYDVVTLTRPWTRSDLSGRVTNDKSPSFTETIVRRQRQISSNDLDDESRLPPPDYRITRSDSSVDHRPVLSRRRTTRTPDTGVPSSRSPTDRLTIMKARDSGMIERPKNESRRPLHACCEPIVMCQLMRDIHRAGWCLGVFAYMFNICI